MQKQTLDQWIREALIDPDKDGACTAISLVHMPGEKEIHTVKFGAKPRDPKELASLFRGKAESYAAEITGVQTFNLLAFYDQRSEPQARKPILVKGHDEYDGMVTEGPDAKGQTMQGMRHLEVVMQMGLRHTSNLLEGSSKTIDALLRQNQQLMQENRDSFDIVKQLMIKQIEGDHTRRMESLAYERASAERAKWLGMAPGLVNTLFGKEIFPQNTADSALIEGMLESLENLPDHAINVLASNVKPEVWGPLADRLTQRMRTRRLKREETEAITQTNGADTGVNH